MELAFTPFEDMLRLNEDLIRKVRIFAGAVAYNLSRLDIGGEEARLVGC